MSRPIDYSRWNHIEVSDDEDDTHPNIDKESLWRWKKQARLQREEKEAAEKRFVIEKTHSAKDSLEELKAKLCKVKEEFGENSSEFQTIQKELEKTEKEYEIFRSKEEQISYQEKNFPKWSSSNICRDGFAKSIVNKIEPDPKKDEELTEEELQERYNAFVKKHKQDIQKFGMTSKLNDSQQLILQNHHLVCEDTANYLVVWTIDLQMEGKTELMRRIARQCIVLQYLLELLNSSKKLNPKDVVMNFFVKMEKMEDEFKKTFQDDLDAFIERVIRRAEEKKIEKAKIAEAENQEDEEEEIILNREERLGPGGLDPLEVAETLPKSLQIAFESRDLSLLKHALSEMDPTEAEYHMKRCTDSGLWVPEASTSSDD